MEKKKSVHFMDIQQQKQILITEQNGRQLQFMLFFWRPAKEIYQLETWKQLSSHEPLNSAKNPNSVQ